MATKNGIFDGGNMKKNIYKITVKNFEKYNSGIKKGHKSCLISTGFLSDAKIRKLTPAGKLLFLSCVLLSAESASSQFEVNHESLCFHSGVKSGSLQSQLAQLEQLQLLSVEKNDSLYNRIEKNRIESNIRVPPENDVSASDPPPPPAAQKLNTPKKEKFQHPKTFSEFRNLFAEDVYFGWIALYESNTEFVEREILAAFQYFYIEKSKPPSASTQGWIRRMASWLNRSWEKRARSGSPSKVVPKSRVVQELKFD